jgi:hypothetical protein
MLSSPPGAPPLRSLGEVTTNEGQTPISADAAAHGSFVSRKWGSDPYVPLILPYLAPAH